MFFKILQHLFKFLASIFSKLGAHYTYTKLFRYLMKYKIISLIYNPLKYIFKHIILFIKITTAIIAILSLFNISLFYYNFDIINEITNYIMNIINYIKKIISKYFSNGEDDEISDETSLTEIKKSMNEINNDLVEIINKIDDSINNNFIGLDIINQLQTYYNKLNYFQCFALTHLSAFIFIFLSLISLVSMYFGDYLIDKFNIENKYPKIFKYIQLRRKFQRYYLILDLIIIFITLIILSILNIMLFYYFTL